MFLFLNCPCIANSVKVFPRVTKCKMLDLKTDVIVAEGCWLSSDLNALVHHIPLSSNTIRVCMDLAMPYMYSNALCVYN